MSEPLGLSVGAANLVAARIGAAPVIRRSVLTVYEDRAPDVGGGQPAGGVVLTGFVERVGDPVPIVAADGSTHRGELVLAEALRAMARMVGGAPVTIAVPAHWQPATVAALRSAVHGIPELAPQGLPATLVADSEAALAGLRTAAGLPTDGVVVLCDFGSSGTTVTLADAPAGLTVIGDSVRYSEFSGELIDGALLGHVVAGISEAGGVDPAATAAVGSLSQLREQCRLAKEQLSAGTAAVLRAELPGYTSDVRVTRPELNRLIDAPLGGLLAAVDDVLQRNQVPLSAVSAAVTVGGGATIPLITQRLSERFRVPVVTTPEPQLAIAAGAAVMSALSAGPDAATGMAPAAAEAPTGLAPTMGWVAGAAAADAALTGAAAAEGSAPFAALAWSQEEGTGEAVMPYTGGEYTSDYSAGYPGEARPEVAFAPGDYTGDQDYGDELGPLPWYKRPTLLFGAAATALLLAVGGLAITLTSGSSTPQPTTEVVTLPNGETAMVVTPPPTTETITLPNGETSTTVVTPSPTTTSPPSTTTSTTTTTTTTATTTTTTTQPTTTQPTTQPTTTQPTTQPTTTQPAPTTQPTEPTTVVTTSAVVTAPDTADEEPATASDQSPAAVPPSTVTLAGSLGTQ